MKLLCLASVATLLLQATVNPLQQQRTQAILEGNVTRLGTGQPIPVARVTLTRRGRPPQGSSPAVAGRPLPPIPPVMTDDKGTFTFRGLDEGAYTVQAQADGYVAQTYGQRFPNGPGTPITLTAGETRKDVTISVTPAANISGRIRDTSGQPVINVPVQLLRRSYDFNGQRTYQAVGAAQTNDRGEYRMYWVTPGRYYLFAGRPSTGANSVSAMMFLAMGGVTASGKETPVVPGYAFYPGVMDIENTRAVDLQPGADLQGVDLALTPKPQTYSIRGRLIDSGTGQRPLRANVFVVTQTPGLNWSGADPTLGADAPGGHYNATSGAIEIRDLLPGTYSVTAIVQNPVAAGSGGSSRQSTGTVLVTVSDSDVDGIVLSLVPAASILGRLRVDGQAPITIDRLRVQLVPTDASAALQQILHRQGSSGFYRDSQTSADGTFRLDDVVPGEYRIDVSSFRPSGGNVLIKEARFEGADVLNSPLRSSDTSSGWLDLVVAVGGGQINGAVTDLHSQPVPNTRVVIIPDRARYRADLYRVATTDENGRFALSAIAPGHYKAFSWEALEEFG